MKHQEKTSANEIAIAFDFQFYYFLVRLLQMKKGESVGLEVKDDVHTDLANNRQILIQLKHTVQKKADDTPINLTCLDVDLWKTLSNWVCIIQDKNDGRENIGKQIEFVKRTDFLLSSNKTENLNNTFLSKVKEFQNGNILFEDLILFIEQLLNRTQSSDIKKYITQVLSLDNTVKNSFFKNVDFDLGVSNVIQLCKDKLEEKGIHPKRIEQVFRNLESQIRQDNFNSIVGGGETVISFDDFYLRYRRFLDQARSELLQIHSVVSPLPNDLESQTFIKQLIDIEDVSPGSDKIISYTMDRLKCIDNITQWCQDGDLTQIDIKSFEFQAKKRWDNIFNKNRKKECSEKAKANSIIDEIREVELKIDGQGLDIDISNGEYYELSNRPEIGWHKDWQNKYKGDIE